MYFGAFLIFILGRLLAFLLGYGQAFFLVCSYISSARWIIFRDHAGLRWLGCCLRYLVALSQVLALMAPSWLKKLSIIHLRVRALLLLYKQRSSSGEKRSQSGIPGPAASALPGNLLESKGPTLHLLRLTGPPAGLSVTQVENPNYSPHWVGSVFAEK